MRLAAVADVHSPKYLELFREALVKVGEPDLFLLVGDLVLKNDFSQLSSVISAIREVYRGEIIACFGNEEFEQDRERYLTAEITWLEDESKTVEVNGLKLGIVGSRGSLDRPTFWQRTHVKGIWQLYKKRVGIIDSLLAGLRADIKVVMTHYAPTYETLFGESERAMPEMACKRLKQVIERGQPDIWFHGHGHRATVLDAQFGKTSVINVSLPAREEIVFLDLPRKVGLEKFLQVKKP